MSQKNVIDIVPDKVNNMIDTVLGPVTTATTIPPVELFPDSIQKFFSTQTIFTIIVITQGLFGGMGLQYTPTFLKKAGKKWYFRLLFVSAIAFSATSDADIAIIVTIVYFLFLHFMKTKEEKKKYPGVF
jgi:hypothetical protein